MTVTLGSFLLKLGKDDTDMIRQEEHETWLKHQKQLHAVYG